jgi:cytochrome c553
MMSRAWVFLLLPLGASVARGQGPDTETFFELKVRPVLAGTCFKCHGGTKVSSGLRVDSRAALLKGGDSGPAIFPGDPDQSLLLQAVRHTHATLRMPPKDKLSEAIISDLAAWIRAGAPWPDAAKAKPFAAQNHWAFQPVRPVTPPPDPTGWAHHPIDRFVMARLRQQGLHPVAPADRRTLLRRATFDLIGLPPAPEEMASFLADDAPDAFEKVMERLLASPHYGERWGRHWLDVARYADTAGDNADYPIPEIRLYRDYVLDAFNADKPFDQFVQEQLAGDVLARQGPREKYAERVAATGFLALSRRYATAPYELWHLTLEDAIETTGAAFLGLTLRCARCHDHKFDPITTRDYYALYGFFASTTFPYAGSEEFASKNMDRLHFVPLVPPDEAAPRLAAYEKKLRDRQAEIRQVEKDGKRAKPGTDLGRLRGELRQWQRPGLPPDLPGAYAVSEGKPVSVPIQIRGDPETPGPVVPRGVPEFLSSGRPLSLPATGSGRLELARWITQSDNPLTARVLVNRIWQHYFGKGLVGTPNNFGLRGDEPTHPELLDWLATEFVRSGWSIKHLHRLILTSKTYQLSCIPDAANAARDPGNRYLGRADRRRLDAEAIRDSLLAVGGHLDRSRPGPHPFPPMRDWPWTQHNPFKQVYPSNHRSVYLMTQRLQRHPFLALFDGPDTNHTTEKRSSSTVPLQALYLMNDPFVREQAEGLAGRLLAAAPDAAGRVARGCELAWGRPPHSDEIEKGTAYIRRCTQELEKAGIPQERRERQAWTSYARVLLMANEFLYLD